MPTHAHTSAESFRAGLDNQTQIQSSRRSLLLAGAGGLAAAALAGTVTSPTDAAAQTATLSTATSSGSPYDVRINLARAQAQIPLPKHRNNGDESRYPTRVANFSKGLPCNQWGEVDPDAYNALLAALSSGDPAAFLRIPLGGERKLSDPQGAFAYLQEGAEAKAVTLPPAPAFGSLREAGDGLEVYWRALTRDVPFTEYPNNPLVAAAVTDLKRFEGYRNINANTIFRGTLPGCTTGPFISQFLWLDIPFGAGTIRQHYRRPEVGADFLTAYDEWLANQSGQLPARSIPFQARPGYIRTGRDLGEYVHFDFSYQAYLSAALILLGYGLDALDEGNPYLSNPSEVGLCTFGGPAILDLVAHVAMGAFKAAWYQKWRVHRRLRPEAWGGRLHNHLTNARKYPLRTELLNSPALDEVYRQHGTYLLPMAYPEGSPTHPAYPGGHATVAGACVTVLKAVFKEDFVIPAPVVPTNDGQSLHRYRGTLTVGGELNKLAANITFGRDTAGVHWRTDGRGLALGEEVAIRMLTDYRELNNEPFAGFSLTKFDGTKITV